MTKRFPWLTVAAFGSALLWCGPDAAAQTIGPVRWQLAPFCNVVTLTIEQKGSVYALTGDDDRCGEVVRSPVTGTATLNGDGSISVGLTTVRPDGFHVITTALVTGPTFSGTWSDKYGTSGTFIINPPSPVTGEPRRITLRGNYVVDFNATGPNQRGASSTSFLEQLPFTPTAPAENFIAVGGASTTNCPGTVANPRAAPGHVCVYERFTLNLNFRCVSAVSGPDWSCDAADRTGFAAFVQSAGAGHTASAGTWAVTIP